MPNIDEIDKDTEVCFCFGVTLGDLLDAIKDGACDLDSLMEATEAGTACGLCVSPEEDPDGDRPIHLTEILEQAKEKGLCK